MADNTTGYSSHERLVAGARAYPQLWRLLAGLGIVVALSLALNAVLFVLIVAYQPQAALFLDGATPFSALVLLFSFVFAIFGVAVAARQVQHRSLGSVIGAGPQAVRQFWQVLKALMLLAAVLFALPPYDMGGPLVPNLPWPFWVSLLPLTLSAILIQTSAEEILFRGYLQQGLAARFRSPLIWMGLPALLFAAGHYAPGTMGDNAMLVTLWALVFGLVTADLTARAGTLGPAIALHFFNNVTALALVSMPDTLGGLALYHLPFDMTQTDVVRPWLYVDFAIMIVGWLTARLALRR